MTTPAIDFAQPSIHYTGILGIMFHETHNQVSLYILYLFVFLHIHIPASNAIFYNYCNYYFVCVDFWEVSPSRIVCSISTLQCWIGVVNT